MVEASLNTAHRRASFLAASPQHSGGWLFAIPIATRGLKLDDEVVRAAVIRLRLGLDLCLPHQYQCGSFVDARWLHSLVSSAKEAPGRSEIPRQVLDRHAVGRILTLTILPMSSE